MFNQYPYNMYDVLTDGNFYWSRHIVATILQPDYDLKEYPNDDQNIVISFESYGLTQGVMGLFFYEDPVGYITDSKGRIVFTKNPVFFFLTFMLVTFINLVMMNCLCVIGVVS